MSEVSARPSPGVRKRGTEILLLLAFAVVSFTTAYLLVDSERVVSGAAIIAWRSAVTAIIIASLVGALILYFGTRATNARALEVFTAAIAGSVFFYSAIAAVTPHQPTDMPFEPCDGFAVRNGVANLETGPIGLSIRSGPSLSSAQIGYMPPECGFAVDAFCPGTPTRDVNPNATTDSRWLIIHQREGLESDRPMFAAASQVQGLISEDLIDNYSATGREDAESFCEEAGGYPDPGPVEVTFESTAQGLDLAIEAEATFQFGVSLYNPNGSDFGSEYVAAERPVSVAGVAAAPAATALVAPETVGRIIGNSGEGIITVARCWGIGAAVQDDRGGWTGRILLDGDTISVKEIEASGTYEPAVANAVACSTSAEIPAVIDPEG